MSKGTRRLSPFHWIDKGQVAYLLFAAAFLVVSPDMRGAIAAVLFGLGWLLREMETTERFFEARREARTRAQQAQEAAEHTANSFTRQFTANHYHPKGNQ